MNNVGFSSLRHVRLVSPDYERVLNRLWSAQCAYSINVLKQIQCLFSDYYFGTKDTYNGDESNRLRPPHVKCESLVHLPRFHNPAMSDHPIVSTMRHLIRPSLPSPGGKWNSAVLDFPQVKLRPMVSNGPLALPFFAP